MQRRTDERMPAQPVEPPFKIGDVVALNSGGEPMTVESVEWRPDARRWQIGTCWVAAGYHQSATFWPEMLQPSAPATPLPDHSIGAALYTIGRIFRGV